MGTTRCLFCFVVSSVSFILDYDSAFGVVFAVNADLIFNRDIVQNETKEPGKMPLTNVRKPLV